MDLFFSMLQTAATSLLGLLLCAFALRAILSWFPLDDNIFTDILYRLTEPFIYPVRLLLYKLNLFQNLPIDMSFLFTVILLSLLDFFVSSL